jgi:hypothetical protein
VSGTMLLMRLCVTPSCFLSEITDSLTAEQDFSGNKVGFWHSTGGDPLKQVVAPVSVSTSSNGADWHLGVLELPRSGYNWATEDFYFSGVYIEDGAITTAVGGRRLSLMLFCVLEANSFLSEIKRRQSG